MTRSALCQLYISSRKYAATQTLSHFTTKHTPTLLFLYLISYVTVSMLLEVYLWVFLVSVCHVCAVL